MRVILDTNVLKSGIFFSGPPVKILRAWRDRKVQLVVSTDILKEYFQVAKRLSLRYSGIDMGPLLMLLIWNIEHRRTGCTGCFFFILSILLIHVQRFLSPLSQPQTRQS